MRNSFFLLFFLLTLIGSLHAQNKQPGPSDQKTIAALIARYAEARERSDTAILKEILTTDVDQLVSTGEWRSGIGEAIKGMLKSAAGSPGTRSLIIDKMRMLHSNAALVDCRYEIADAGTVTRKMWSSFIVVSQKKKWKISAICNMLPAANP